MSTRDERGYLFQSCSLPFPSIHSHFHSRSQDQPGFIQIPFPADIKTCLLAERLCEALLSCQSLYKTAKQVYFYEAGASREVLISR